MAARRGHAANRVVEQHGRLDALLDERDGLLALLDRVAALRGTAGLIRDVAGAHAGFVSDLEAGRDEAVIRWLAGNRTEALRGVEVPVGLGLGGRALALRLPVRVTDYVSAPVITHHFDGPVRAEGLSAMLAVPIFDGNRPLAVAYAALRETAWFGDAAVTAVQRVAGQAATALRLAERAEQRSSTAVAADRRRLQASLHDSVGAMLFSIGAQVHDLAGTAGHDPVLAERLRSLEADVSAASQALRESLHSLSETAPDRALAVAVAEHCRSFESRTGIPARFVQLGGLPGLDAERGEVLTTAVREGLLNVEKHAHASSVVVSLGEDGGGVLVAVADDGAGEEPEQAGTPAGSGLGLAALVDRVGAVGGRVSLVRDEDGATLRAWVPAPRRSG
ncbi:MAG: GAF domain-containing protein [Pseudonocardiaceae bacterium]|nr:GAF domain-containing protein [Pseudonocardiaceae bacterium]